jgi:hypothetical protein
MSSAAAGAVLCKCLVKLEKRNPSAGINNLSVLIYSSCLTPSNQTTTCVIALYVKVDMKVAVYM